jgi:hypothetical protein
MQYLIVIEKTATGYSAYSPDLDGGGDRRETRFYQNIWRISLAWRWK